MKNNRLSFAITAVAIAAIISVAAISCKKETDNRLNQKTVSTQNFDLRQIKDLSAYLKDFKKKMTESKSGEAFSLDDAAWHLASLANRDFCNVNVKYDDMQFDTVEMSVNVTNGALRDPLHG